MNPQSGAGVPFDSAWNYSPMGTTAPTTYNPQSGAAPTTQPNANLVQQTGQVQTTANPQQYVDPTATLGASTSVASVDPAQAAAAAQAAADAAKAAQLRTNITDLVNQVKDLFNARYGQVANSAGEQIGKLNDRYATESGQLTDQISSENDKIGAASAASGVFDSSYRGNNVDTVTKAGQSQIQGLGTELQDNIAKIAQWVASQNQSFDAGKSAYDKTVSRLPETTDLKELTQLRNEIESRITELTAGNADNNTAAQNAQSLNNIAPTSSRAVQLKTTLSQIIAGNADAGQKSAIAEKLITSSGLSPEETQALLNGFKNDLAATTTQDKQQQA
ncbi:MAG: hypothetical protein KDH96_02030 [Candidatus Riesia sp.]|nr:hypothetical protein [Candidatus Riesia sp.]